MSPVLGNKLRDTPWAWPKSHCLGIPWSSSCWKLANPYCWAQPETQNRQLPGSCPRSPPGGHDSVRWRWKWPGQALPFPRGLARAGVKPSKMVCAGRRVAALELKGAPYGLVVLAFPGGNHSYVLVSPARPFSAAAPTQANGTRWVRVDSIRGVMLGAGKCEDADGDGWPRHRPAASRPF